MNLKQIFATARREYSLKPFTEKEALNNPFKLFDLWIRQAAKSGVWDANAMTLSTLDSKAYPTSRIVLLKGFDKNGFTFFTNYKSDKGNQIKSRSKVGLLFFWPELIRQVRINGTASKISRKESERYFATRPRGSQISAWASPQSETVKDYAQLKKLVQETQAKFQGKKIPCPPHWGGYRVKPNYIEFWHGRLNRLHDRFTYKPTRLGWKHERLAP